jgi:soluble lytic murein transglycosylase-like protein
MSSRLAAIAWCESRNRPGAVSPDGRYRGKYQFHPATWAALGGVGDPAAAPVAEQDRLAARLYAQTGGSAWPVCGRYGG